ncbi:MAG: alpha/beta hydrolase [Rubritalea sp.]|uniref:alpha/beta hydrolase n=1 Tax=Rubritalea sp. TaxID=2109375 RepID=UPI0032422151
MDSSDKSVSPIAVIRDEELLKGAESIVYKRTEKGDLTLHCFYPEGHDENDRRSAIVLFHGGEWDQPMVTQFVPQALNFVALGAVGIVAEYRTASAHSSTPLESISDAQTAILWVRKNNRYLGVDPEKIIAGGSGSGAHIALCSAMHKKVENNGFFSGAPNALILWSAIVDTTKRGLGMARFAFKRDARRTSPNKNIRRKLPPMLFFHGKEDPIVPVSNVDKFAQRLRSKRNVARFVPFNRATHSFFNFNVNQHYFVQTLESAEGFLIDQGFLEPSPNDVIE